MPFSPIRYGLGCLSMIVSRIFSTVITLSRVLPCWRVSMTIVPWNRCFSSCTRLFRRYLLNSSIPPIPILERSEVKRQVAPVEQQQCKAENCKQDYQRAPDNCEECSDSRVHENYQNDRSLHLLAGQYSIRQRVRNDSYYHAHCTYVNHVF